MSFSNTGRRKRRRESPTYDDYHGDEESNGTARGRFDRRPSPVYEDYDSGGYTRRQALSGNSHRAGSDKGEKTGHGRRPSPSIESFPDPFLRGLDFSKPIGRDPSPCTEPSEDYLLTSARPSWRLQDPSESRKLVVLDLNGSLLLRSPHSRRQGRPGQRLRSVYPRPYLPAFRSYIFHEETKRWLDAMVWSSAQPHSVDDMVEKCFQGKKGELKAIWTRDTLGLNADEYHRKTQTLKDLEKPWAVLKDTSSEIEIQHSALTTMLIDDSTLKAALQPWNHLCIMEYVTTTRSSDLKVAEFEATRRRMREAREVLEQERRRDEELRMQEAEEAELRRLEGERMIKEAVEDPNVTKVYREIAFLKGTKVGETHLMKKVVKEVAVREGEIVEESVEEGEDVDMEKSITKQKMKKKMKRLAKKEAVRKAKEKVERETLISQTQALRDAEVEEGEIGSEELAEEQEREETKLEALASSMKYDETLLAVIGILDHIKYEGNVAGWMRQGGLLHVGSKADESHARTPSSSPSKRRRLNEPESGDNNTRLSSPATLPLTSSPITSSSGDHLPSTSPINEQQDQARTGIPLGSGNGSTRAPAKLWFNQPDVMSYWADRGRQTLKTLNIPVESGIELPSYISQTGHRSA